VLLDALGGVGSVRAFMGEPAEPLVDVGRADAALITHLHPDHFDPATLSEQIGEGWVACPADTAQAVAATGLRSRGVEPWERVELAGFGCTAVPAVDGLGDSQVSWVVADGDVRLIHCGDTLWHGQWWRIAARAGPFAVAFLCINGARIRFPNLAPSGIEADLTPEQAAGAAAVLGAKLAVPIHYRLFDNPPAYEETRDAESRFVVAAAERHVRTRILEPGDTLELA
jgi:L-ascorbate metabolism protein UlaG (beta-lactamase superfamily)